MYTENPTDSRFEFRRDIAGYGADSAEVCLGLILCTGDRISKSDYELRMGHDVECAHLCDVALDAQAAKELYDLIHDDYMVEWFDPLLR